MYECKDYPYSMLKLVPVQVLARSTTSASDISGSTSAWASARSTSASGSASTSASTSVPSAVPSDSMHTVLEKIKTTVGLFMHTVL